MIDRELIPMVAARFKALADEGRLALLAALQRGERSVGQLVAATGRSQPNVSQHLASLTHAGLVEARRDGTRAFYRIADPTVLRICDVVCDTVAGRAAEPPARRRQPGRASGRPAGRVRGARSGASAPRRPRIGAGR